MDYNKLLLPFALVCGGSLTDLDESRAAGFSVPETSVAGVGLSNALVANPDELGAFVYNPAAMAFHPGSSITLGALGVVPDLSTDTSTGAHDSGGKDLIGIPMFFGALRVGSDWTLGLGVSAPFGLQTKWDLGTFPVLSTPETSAAHPTETKLSLVAVTPVAAYRINDNASISAGFDYYGVTEVKFNTAAIDVQGDGGDYGWNLGFLYKMGKWSFGASYHNHVELTIDGKLQAFEPAGPGTAVPAKANLNLPWRAQAGVRYEATEDLAVELDISRTGWSEFDAIVIEATGLLPGGTVLATSTNDWDDSNAYRLGLSYRWSPSTELRFGYSFDKTPQGDDHFSARIPDANRHLLSIGVDHDLGNGWGVEAGYMYVYFKDRDYRGSVPFGTYGSDPNGTSAYDGDYSAHVQLLSVGLRKEFL